MPRHYQVPLHRPLGPMIQEALPRIREMGGRFYGDDTAGEFAVKGVEGSYFVEGQMMYITLMKKPVFVSDKMVEKVLHDVFG